MRYGGRGSRGRSTPAGSERETDWTDRPTTVGLAEAGGLDVLVRGSENAQDRVIARDREAVARDVLEVFQLVEVRQVHAAAEEEVADDELQVGQAREAIEIGAVGDLEGAVDCLERLEAGDALEVLLVENESAEDVREGVEARDVNEPVILRLRARAPASVPGPRRWGVAGRRG